MTEGLLFCPIEVAHAEGLFHALDFDSVYQFITQPRPSNSDEVLVRIKRFNAGPSADSGQEWLNFVVLLDDKIIGHLQATVSGSRAEIAYLFNPVVSGRGYATTGTRWLMDHLCIALGVNEFWATTDPANLRSIALLKRCGFNATSLPAHGLLSYDEGDAIFHLGRNIAS